MECSDFSEIAASPCIFNHFVLSFQIPYSRNPSRTTRTEEKGVRCEHPRKNEWRKTGFENCFYELLFLRIHPPSLLFFAVVYVRGVDMSLMLSFDTWRYQRRTCWNYKIYTSLHPPPTRVIKLQNLPVRKAAAQIWQLLLKLLRNFVVLFARASFLDLPTLCVQDILSVI